jgi:hypothetical protein
MTLFGLQKFGSTRKAPGQAGSRGFQEIPAVDPSRQFAHLVDSLSFTYDPLATSSFSKNILIAMAALLL